MAHFTLQQQFSIPISAFQQRVRSGFNLPQLLFSISRSCCPQSMPQSCPQSMQLAAMLCQQLFGYGHVQLSARPFSAGKKLNCCLLRRLKPVVASMSPSAAAPGAESCSKSAAVTGSRRPAIKSLSSQNNQGYSYTLVHAGAAANLRLWRNQIRQTASANGARALDQMNSKYEQQNFQISTARKKL
jgi:hypothetical protein